MSEDTLSAINNFFGGDSTEDDFIRVGNPKALEQFYAKVKMKYNLEELRDILDCEDNMLIIAGAGAGKTTSLLLKILRDILSGRLLKWVEIDGRKYLHIKRILVSTFLKTGAEELAKKFDELCKDFKIVGVTSKAIAFKTIHSEVYAALKEMGVTISIMEPGSEGNFLADACRYYKIHSIMGNGKALTKEEISDIQCVVAYVRNRLDRDRYNHPLMHEYGLNDVNLPAVLKRYKDLKQVAKVQDFEDLEEQLYDAYSKFPNVLNFIKSRYDFVYVDEFQDTSQLQYAILEPYFKSAEGFICIGDDDQTIYSWRGSDIKVITERFEKDYHPVVKQLTVNRRCPKNILNAVIPSIEKNSFRHPKQLQSHNPDGTINIVVDGGVNFLTKSIKEDLERSEKVGILGRTNADLLIPTMVLLIDGYDSFSVSKSLSLNERIPSQVLGVIQLLTQRYNEKFEGYLKLFLSKYYSYEATRLADMLSTCPDYSLMTVPLEDLKYSAPNLFPILRILRIEAEQDPVKAYLSLLEIMEQDVYNGKTIYAQRARDFTYYVRKIIKEHEKVKGKSIYELDDLFNRQLPKDLDARKSKKEKKTRADGSIYYETPPDTAFVRITTVHDAKGKEWENVYIWNNVDGCFPNSVGARELSEEEFEEERRVHYIAWTRPRKKLTVFTRSDRAEGRSFLYECDLNDANFIEMDENRKKVKVKDVNTIASTEVFRKKESTESSMTVEKTWEDYFKEYVLKYTDFKKICTPEGSHLDVCLTKMGGIDGVMKYLKSCNIELYPFEELEDVITDILESKYNTYE